MKNTGKKYYKTLNDLIQIKNKCITQKEAAIGQFRKINSKKDDNLLNDNSNTTIKLNTKSIVLECNSQIEYLNKKIFNLIEEICELRENNEALGLAYTYLKNEYSILKSTVSKFENTLRSIKELNLVFGTSHTKGQFIDDGNLKKEIVIYNKILHKINKYFNMISSCVV